MRRSCPATAADRSRASSRRSAGATAIGLECEPHLEVSGGREGPGRYQLVRLEIGHDEALFIGPPPLPVYRFGFPAVRRFICWSPPRERLQVSPERVVPAVSLLGFVN